MASADFLTDEEFHGEAFWHDIEDLREFFTKVMPPSVVEAIVPSGRNLSLDERLQLLAFTVEKDIENRPQRKDLPDPCHDATSQGAALHLLASIRLAQGHYEAADAVYRKLLVGDDPFHPDLKALFNLAMIDVEREHWKDAEAHFWALVPLLQAQVGENSPQALGGLRALMNCVLSQGRVEEADELHQKGVKLVEQMEDGDKAGYKLKADEKEAMDEMGRKIQEKLSRL